MKNIRIGNDINVIWTLVREEGNYPLDGLDVSLYLKSMFGREALTDFSVSENKVFWTFYGKDQSKIGRYSLELVINEGDKGMVTTDICDFVNLVNCSCKSDGFDDNNIVTETIELTSSIEFTPPSMEIEVDNELSETSLNPVQNKVITAELNKKADKTEVPTKLSQLEQDIEIGGEGGSDFYIIESFNLIWLYDTYVWAVGDKNDIAAIQFKTDEGQAIWDAIRAGKKIAVKMGEDTVHGYGWAITAYTDDVSYLTFQYDDVGCFYLGIDTMGGVVGYFYRSVTASNLETFLGKSPKITELSEEIGNMASGEAIQELAGDVNGKYETIATTTYVSGAGLDFGGLSIEKGKAYKVQISLEESKVNSKEILGGIKLYKNGVLVQTVVSTTIVLDEPIKGYDFVADEDADQIKTGYVYGADSTKTFELQRLVKGLSQKLQETSEKLQETSEIILGEIEQGGFEYNQENPSDYILTYMVPAGRLYFRTDNASPYSGVVQKMDIIGNLESRNTPRVEVVVLRKEANTYKGISSHTLYIHPGLNQFNNLNIEVEQGDILGVSGKVGEVDGTIRTYNIVYDGNVESLNFNLSSAQYGNTTFAFFPYLEPNYKEALAEQVASNDIMRVSREPLVPNKNLFDKDNLVEKLWVRETGVFKGDSHKGIYIKVKEGFTYCWNRDDRYTGFIALMDSELNYISSVVESQLPRTSEGGYMFTIPQNVAYIAIEVNHNEDTFQFEEGIHNTSYEPYRLVAKKEETAIPQNFDVYANVCILGDSTASKSLGAWYYWLTSKYSLFNCLDLAVGSATYSHKANTTIDTNPEAMPNGDNNVIVNQVNRLMMLIDNGEAVKPDVFLILGGRNDCTRGEEYLGNADETCEDETTIYSDLLYNDAKLQTMCGGIRMVVETILKNIPNARIVLMSPLHASKGAKKTIKARDLVENMASYLSCDFLDLTKMSGISFVSERQYYYTSDSVHPSVLGGRRIADIVGNYLMTLFHKKWMDYAKYKVTGTGDANTLYSFRFIEGLGTPAAVGVQSVTTDSEGKYEVLLGAGRWRVYKSSGFANLVKDWFDVAGDMTLDL